MLQKENRLKNEKAIKALHRKGIIYKNKFFICKFFKRDDLKCQFAFIVSKKIAKSAVKRNRITRRLREALRLHIDKCPEVYAMILGSDRVLDADFLEIVNEIEKLFHFMKVDN